MDPQQFRKQIPRVSRFDYGQNQLNIKFKIAFSTIHYDGVNKKYVPDNCIELLSITQIIHTQKGKHGHMDNGNLSK